MKPINVEKLQRLLIRKWRKAHDKRVQDIRATDPCPDCGGRKYLAKHSLNGTYYVHCYCPKLKATSPEPAVCEWHDRGILHGAQIYAASCDGRARATYGMSLCPHCDRKISIKSEAAR